MMKFYPARILLLALVITGLVACGGQAPDPGSDPLPITEAPDPTTMIPVDNGVPTATVAALAEVVVVAAESTTAPTVTPAGTATPTPIPSPTVTPEPVFLFTAADFGSDYNPFTGQLMADPSLLQRRPIACKLSNHPPHYTRPQAGLNDADLVFEHLNAWSSTRFTAIFYGTTPPDVGPVRSGRLIDLELPAMYDAALCFSGANGGITQELAASDIAGRLLYSNVDGFYRTDEDKPSEHTLHADLNGLWAELDSRGRNVAPTLHTNMAFTTLPPDGGEPAGHISLKQPSEIAEWRYEPENGRYWRWSDGEIHRDANTDEQVNFSNVVAVFAVHMPSPKACARVTESGCEVQSIEIQLWGRGRAVIFRDGLVYNATWRRDNRHDMLTFYDADGNPLPLRPGNTFFEILTTHQTGQLTYEP